MYFVLFDRFYCDQSTPKFPSNVGQSCQSCFVGQKVFNVSFVWVVSLNKSSVPHKQ